MAGIHLIAQSDGEVVIPVPGGPPLTVPKRRIRAWVLLGNQVVLRQAIIDTGAPYCTPTRRVWADLDRRGQIDWVAFPPGGPVASLPTMELLGGNHPFRVLNGRTLVVQASEVGDRWFAVLIQP